jgi:hypothetical protein
MSRPTLLMLSVISIVLTVSVLAGCGSSSSLDGRSIEVNGDQLLLPDSTTIEVRVSGKLPAACDSKAPDTDCLHVSTTHGCDLQTFRVSDTFQRMELGPPRKDDQKTLVLTVPVEPYQCER